MGPGGPYAFDLTVFHADMTMHGFDNDKKIETIRKLRTIADAALEEMKS